MQRRLPEMEQFSCKKRLEKIDLFSWEQRKLRGDIIEVCKIMRIIDWVDCKKHFSIRGSKTKSITI